MNSHKNARLTPLGRVHLMRQIIRIAPKATAAQARISTRRAHTWRKRWHDCGTGGLCSRSSRPVASPRRTQPDKRERIIRLRRNYRLRMRKLPAAWPYPSPRWDVFASRLVLGCRPLRLHHPSTAMSGKYLLQDGLAGSMKQLIETIEDFKRKGIW
jgi:hypothetical protein